MSGRKARLVVPEGSQSTSTSTNSFTTTASRLHSDREAQRVPLGSARPVQSETLTPQSKVTSYATGSEVSDSIWSGIDEEVSSISNGTGISGPVPEMYQKANSSWALSTPLPLSKNPLQDLLTTHGEELSLEDLVSLRNVIAEHDQLKVFDTALGLMRE